MGHEPRGSAWTSEPEPATVVSTALTSGNPVTVARIPLLDMRSGSGTATALGKLIANRLSELRLPLQFACGLSPLTRPQEERTASTSFRVRVAFLIVAFLITPEGRPHLEAKTAAEPSISRAIDE